MKDEGFGVLTDIDVQATLKSKIGADMPKYRILGACNPGFSYEGLEVEDKLIVRETNDGRVEVASVDPVVARSAPETLRWQPRQKKSAVGCPRRSTL